MNRIQLARFAYDAGATVGRAAADSGLSLGETKRLFLDWRAAERVTYRPFFPPMGAARVAALAELDAYRGRA